MNALEAASLVMIPSGYEDGTLGSLKPTDGTGDFTFTRGSNISATRVNADGNIEKGYENLLLHSNDFSQSNWVKNNISVTGGQIGYDGSNNAWEVENGGRRYFFQNVTYPSQVKTFSVYAKSGNQDSFAIYVVKDGGDPSVTCDLGLGTITSGDPDNIDATITPVSGATGWYRISITWLAASTGGDSLRIYTGLNLGDTIIIQDAMLNQGLVAYPYVETTTAPVAGGILEDMPRLDYSNGSCPSLLLEPERTNRCTLSEYFEGAAWLSIGSPTITTNYGISPEGVKNSTRIQFSGTNQCIYDGIAYTSEEVSTIYVKGTSGETIKFGKGDNIFVGDIFTLDGTWQRLKFVQSVSGNTFTINTSGGATARDIEIWGAQNEQGSYPTSYIPTYGVSQTRLEDAALSSALNLSKGDFTLFVEFEFYGVKSGDEQRFYLSDGTSDNSAILGVRNGSEIQISRESNNVLLFNSTLSNQFSAGNNYKFLGKWSSGDNKTFLNGVLKTTDTTTTSDFAVDITHFNLTGNGAQSSMLDYGLNIKQVLYFPEALSDEACIELTTI